MQFCFINYKHHAVYYVPMAYFIFNWRIIALQYCIGLCHTTTWISHEHVYVPSLSNLPPLPTPSQPSTLSQSTVWAPCAMQQIPVQLSSVALRCPTLCDPMNRSAPGLPVHHQLPEFTQTRVHRVGDAMQPSHPRLPPSPPAPSPPQQQGLFQWAICFTCVADMFQCCPLNRSHLLLPTLCPKSVLYVCVSILALQTGSSVPLF